MIYINARFLTQTITGVQRYAIEISKELKLLYDNKITFVSPPNIIHFDIAKELNAKIVGEHRGHLWEQISLPHFLKKEGSPLLISFSGCGLLNYKNQIITIHDVSFRRHPEWFTKSYLHYYNFMIPRIAAKAHAIITVSEFSKGEIADVLGIEQNRIEVIYNAVSKNNKIQNFSNSNIFLNNYILAVSSLEPRKNFSRLVEAFNGIGDKNVKLYIIGKQFKVFSTLKLQKEITKSVIFTGYLDESKLKDMYKKALFLIYPSLYEGFGLPPIEAMSFGCPVIASDIPAIHEICESAVLYTDPLSIEDMITKMNFMIENKDVRENFKQVGFKQVKKFSWTESAKQVFALSEKFHQK
jgi:glycosyltransferase involved in cell wall biosynthesis